MVLYASIFNVKYINILYFENLKIFTINNIHDSKCSLDNLDKSNLYYYCGLFSLHMYYTFCLLHSLEALHCLDNLSKSN